MTLKIDPAIREKYLDWLMTPPAYRDPTSKQKFADDHGVHVQTLRYWEKSDEFKSRLAKLKAEWGQEYHADIIGKLLQIVASRDDSVAVQAAKILLQHLDVPSEQKEDIDLTPEAITRIKGELKAAGYNVIE